MSFAAYPVALAAAACFAVATPLEHRAADRAPQAGSLAPRRVVAFVRAVVSDRAWLGGMVLNGLGVGLHAFALYLGALAVVQPLLVANVLFALPVNHVLRREPVRREELAWGAALVVGLSGFLLVGTAGLPSAGGAPDVGPAAAAGVLTVVVVGALVLSARRAGRTTAATLFGISTGVLFAVTASLIKQCTELLATGPIALLTGWQLYALLVVGTTGMLLNQLAYQAGPLAASLPAITVVDPLVAILLGIVVFDEHLRHTAPAIVGEVVALALLSVAALRLSRLERVDESTDAPVAGEPTDRPG